MWGRYGRLRTSDCNYVELVIAYNPPTSMTSSTPDVQTFLISQIGGLGFFGWINWIPPIVVTVPRGQQLTYRLGPFFRWSTLLFTLSYQVNLWSGVTVWGESGRVTVILPFCAAPTSWPNAPFLPGYPVLAYMPTYSWGLLTAVYDIYRDSNCNIIVRIAYNAYGAPSSRTFLIRQVGYDHRVHSSDNSWTPLDDGDDEFQYAIGGQVTIENGHEVRVNLGRGRHPTIALKLFVPGSSAGVWYEVGGDPLLISGMCLASGIDIEIGLLLNVGWFDWSNFWLSQQLGQSNGNSGQHRRLQTSSSPTTISSGVINASYPSPSTIADLLSSSLSAVLSTSLSTGSASSVVSVWDGANITQIAAGSVDSVTGNRRLQAITTTSTATFASLRAPTDAFAAGVTNDAAVPVGFDYDESGQQLVPIKLANAMWQTEVLRLAQASQQRLLTTTSGTAVESTVDITSALNDPTGWYALSATLHPLDVNGSAAAALSSSSADLAPLSVQVSIRVPSSASDSVASVISSIATALSDGTLATKLKDQGVAPAVTSSSGSSSSSTGAVSTLGDVRVVDASTGVTATSWTSALGDISNTLPADAKSIASMAAVIGGGVAAAMVVTVLLFVAKFAYNRWASRRPTIVPVAVDTDDDDEGEVDDIADAPNPTAPPAELGTVETISVVHGDSTTADATSTTSGSGVTAATTTAVASNTAIKTVKTPRKPVGRGLIRADSFVEGQPTSKDLYVDPWGQIQVRGDVDLSAFRAKDVPDASTAASDGAAATITTTIHEHPVPVTGRRVSDITGIATSTSPRSSRKLSTHSAPGAAALGGSMPSATVARALNDEDDSADAIRPASSTLSRTSALSFSPASQTQLRTTAYGTALTTSSIGAASQASNTAATEPMPTSFERSGPKKLATARSIRTLLDTACEIAPAAAPAAPFTSRRLAKVSTVLGISAPMSVRGTHLLHSIPASTDVQPPLTGTAASVASRRPAFDFIVEPSGATSPRTPAVQQNALRSPRTPSVAVAITSSTNATTTTTTAVSPSSLDDTDAVSELFSAVTVSDSQAAVLTTPASPRSPRSAVASTFGAVAVARTPQGPAMDIDGEGMPGAQDRRSKSLARAASRLFSDQH